MPDFAAIAADMLAGHPVTGAFDADDQIATNEWNAKNRVAEGGVLGMLNYLAKNRSRTNTGTDLTATSIVGRLKSVAEALVGDDPFGATGNTLTMEHIHAAKMFIILLASPQVNTFDFVSAEVTAMMDALGGGSGNAKVWKAADIDALKALSQNQQSWSVEQGHGLMRVGYVEQARAL